MENVIVRLWGRRLIRYPVIVLMCALAVVAVIALGSDSPQDLRLPVITHVETLPATARAFQATQEVSGGPVEDSGILRFVPVELDGRSKVRLAQLPETCAVPEPGTRLNVQVLTLRAGGTVIGETSHGHDQILVVDCR